MNCIPRDRRSSTPGRNADGRFDAVANPLTFDSMVAGNTFKFRATTSYDAGGRRMAVGDPANGKVSLLSVDQIFAGRFE